MSSKINQICPIPPDTVGILVRISPLASDEAVSGLKEHLKAMLDGMNLPLYPVIGDIFYSPLTNKNIDEVMDLVGVQQFDVYAWKKDEYPRGGCNDHIKRVHGVKELRTLVETLQNRGFTIQVAAVDDLNGRVNITSNKVFTEFIDSLDRWLEREKASPCQTLDLNLQTTGPEPSQKSSSPE